MKAFITGAGGFVGRELLNQCRQKGMEVTAVDLREDANFGIISADIRSKSISDLIPEEADAVIHLAGLTRDPDCKNKGYECFDANVMATLNMIDAVQKRNVKQFIFASTEWVYGECADGKLLDEDSLIDAAKLKSEYAFSKFTSEVNLRQKFLHGFCDTTILRFGIIYGSRAANFSAVESIFNTVRTKSEVKVGCLKTGRRFIHVSDIAAGIIASIGLKGLQVLNLEGERLITLKDIIETSKQIVNKDPVVIEGDPANINIRNISGDKAKKVLNWSPKVDLKNGLVKLNDFLIEHESGGSCRFGTLPSSRVPRLSLGMVS